MNSTGPSPYCGRAAATALLIGFALQIGCVSHSDFSESLNPEAARDRLLLFLPLPSADLRVLHYRKDTQRDAEYWVLLSEAAPELNSLAGVRGPSACPVDSVFQFAAACKIDEDYLEPVLSKSASDSQQGRLWQWSQGEQQLRLRSVQGAQGVLSVVEKTP